MCCRRHFVVFVVLLLYHAAALPARAQQIDLSKEAYLMPPKEIADAVLASENENFTLTNLSPDGKKFLINKNDGMPTLARMAKPCVYLGEMAFDHNAHRSRQLWVRSQAGFDLFYHADKRTVPVHVPKGARVSNPSWSPDGSKLAFFTHFEDATHIYVADTATGESRQVTTTPVLATLVTSFQWSKDGKQIQTLLLPDDGKRPLPKPNGVATEPRVRLARDGNNPSRTYRFLLESPFDSQLLEHLATGQLALINIDDGKVTKIGSPDMIRSISMAPGEQQFRVATVKKPFSYYVPMSRFGSVEGIWSREGKSVCTLVDRKLQENEPVLPTTPTAGPAGRFGGRTRTGATPPTAGQPATVPGQPVADPPTPVDPDTAPRFGAAQQDPEGRRDIVWRPDGAGLSYLQQEPADLKDANKPRKDRVMQWLPPFEKEKAKVIYETPQRVSSLQYSPDCQMIFLTQTIDSQRQISAIDLKDPKTVYIIHKSDARFGGPGVPPAGAPMTGSPGESCSPSPLAGEGWGEGEEQQRGPGFGFGAIAASGLLTRTAGGSVVRISSTGDVYVTGSDRPRGEGAPAFPKPYIDKIHIKTGKKTRIFEGKGEMLETIDAVDGDNVTCVFTTRQKTDVVPDSYKIELGGGKVTKLTNNVNRGPWFQQLKVERFQVTRVDGFKSWVKVTTPPKRDGKLPAMFWIYPREYADQAAYNAASGRTTATSQRFAAPNPRSMTLLTLLGYAVVEPDVPIVGPAGRMNDNYVPDLRNSLWAVIDELDKKGIIDRDRLAIGGHSYGAFSTANALAHTPFFKAGIAGDGNYNRTLTMMSFQTERRQLWDARETYLEMSPLLWANRVNGALLMYHGMDDANTGTNPINAEYMFMALDGLGKPAALYMYPYEGHGPIAKETTLDLWARWVAWLDLYVKKAGKEKK